MLILVRVRPLSDSEQMSPSTSYVLGWVLARAILHRQAAIELLHVRLLNNACNQLILRSNLVVGSPRMQHRMRKLPRMELNPQSAIFIHSVYRWLQIESNVCTGREFSESPY